MSTHKAKITLKGLRPLLFDRYAGNEAKLLPIDKVYWNKDGTAVMPAINLYSGLTAENSKSVCKMFYGKKAKPMGVSVANQLRIEAYEIPLLYEDKEISRDDFDDKFTVVNHVARINKAGTAIPNPKERPQLDIPWSLSFDVAFTAIANSEVNWDVMIQMFDQLGTLGLGTYRPLYGQFNMSMEEI